MKIYSALPLVRMITAFRIETDAEEPSMSGEIFVFVERR